MSSVRVSIVIPTHNRGKLLAATLRSVKEQTLQDYEILVVDDASTDATHSVAAAFDNVIYIRLPVLTGVAGARNAGIDLARGDYVALLDSDDLWYPAKLEKQVKLLDNDHSLGLVFTDTETFNDQGIIHPSLFKRARPYSGRVIPELFRSNFIVTSSVILRRQVFHEVGSFDGRWSPAEDYDMWFRIALRFPIDFVNSPPLTRYRVHSGALSSGPARLVQRIEVRRHWLHAVPRRYRDDSKYMDESLWFLYRRLGLFYLSLGEGERARASFETSRGAGRRRDLALLAFVVLSYLPSGCLRVGYRALRGWIHPAARLMSSRRPEIHSVVGVSA